MKFISILPRTNKKIMSQEISIKGLCKVTLLHKMWTHQRVAAFYSLSGHAPPEFDVEEANIAIGTYIDYFCGRAIKTDLSGDSISSSYAYDRDSYKKLEDIIAEMI